MKDKDIQMYRDIKKDEKRHICRDITSILIYRDDKQSKITNVKSQVNRPNYGKITGYGTQLSLKVLLTSSVLLNGTGWFKPVPFSVWALS